MSKADCKNIIILGPTSSGKTSLAIKLARKFGLDIISADSRQIYKLMDVGTGKIPANFAEKVIKKDGYYDFEGVKVFGYDLVFPNEYFSTYDFLTYVSGLPKQKVNLYVGGTGFYLNALLGGVKLSGAKPDLDLRKTLELQSKEELFEQLQSVDPNRAAVVDKNNKVRLIRALETKLSAQSHESQTMNDGPATLQNPLIIGLKCENSVLYKKIDEWVDGIYKNGLLEETKKLIEQGFENSRPLQGLIYKSALSYLKGETDLAHAVERSKFDIHAYVRRQYTYFRKIKGVNWFDVLSNGFDSGIFKLVESYLDE